MNNVALIHGGTRDEMRSVVAEHLAGAGGPLSAEQYPHEVRELYGNDATKVLARYPATDYPSPSLALATLMTDEGAAMGACSQLPYNDAHTRRAPTYAYEFAEESARVMATYHSARITAWTSPTSSTATCRERRHPR
jgi:para-nitrobenzyl esterase